MVIDNNNLFTTNNDLLIEVSQFVNCLSNKILSENINFQRDIGINTLDSFNAQLIEEINEYKVYDCWYATVEEVAHTPLLPLSFPVY